MLKKFAKIEPNNLTITITKENDNNIPYNLTIENLTNKYLIIKFLINTKKILLVNPPTSFILPSQKSSFELTIKTNNLSLDEYKKTKLLIIIIPSEEEIKTNEQAKNMYQNLKKQEIDKQEILFELNWTMEEIINTDINNNINNNNNNNKEEKIIFENYANKKNQLNSKYEEILKNIEINKKKLEKMMEQKSQENIKDKGNNVNKYNFDNLIMITIILLGLVFGANFAIGYNKLFKK
jgi:hypothetical protein